MKKILFILVIGMLTSCSIRTEDDGKIKSGDLEFDIIKVGGCQYITTLVGDNRLFTHKGDCNNPIHNTEPNGKNVTN